MTTETVRRASARRPRSNATPYLTLAAGALLVTVPPLVELVSYEAFSLMGVAGLLLLAALPGLRRLQDGADGRAGLWGLRLTMWGLLAGVVLILSGDLIDAAVSGDLQAMVEVAYLAVGATAGLSMLVGVVLYSVGLTRGHVFPPAAVYVFLCGMVVALISESFEQSLRGPVPWLADTLPPVGFVGAGIGLIVIGRAALHRDRARVLEGRPRA